MRTRRQLLAALVLAMPFVAAGGPDHAGATPPPLFSAAESPGIRPPDQVPPVRRRFVRPNVALLAEGASLRLNLFSDTEVTAVAATGEVRGGGLRSWSAAVAGTTWDRALLVEHAGALTGRVTLGDAIYEIVPVAGGIHEIRQIDRHGFPPEAESPPSGSPSPAPAADVVALRAVSEDRIDQIRILMVYTAAADAASADIAAAAQLAVDVANDAYANSGMATRLDLVAAREVDYDESGDLATDLNRLRQIGDGYLDEVHELRDGYLADVVSMLVADGGAYCGMAKLMSPVSPTFEGSAFSVVWLPCASSNWTTAHEVGHNMGCQHDRANATSVPAFPYAYGFQDPGKAFRTIMAISTGCDDCPRVAHFANPDVTYAGLPTGVPLDQPEMAACAVAIDATSPITTDFRTLAAPSMLEASTSFSDHVDVVFEHPWPWAFQVYRAVAGSPPAALALTTGSPFEDFTAEPGVAYDYWVGTLTALGEESTLAGPVPGMVAVPVCGDEVVNEPAEECDDGATFGGDGCSATCISEEPLASAPSRCLVGMNDRALRVAKAQGRANLTCVARAASGAEPDASTCIVADAKQKVAMAHEKALAADASLCGEPPSFGYAGGDTAATAAETERRAWLLDLFGEELSAALRSKAADPAGAMCQRTVAKAADRMIASSFDSFVACKRDRVRSGTMYTEASLDSCFDAVRDDAADAGSKLAEQASRLSLARAKSCAGLSLAEMFPGACSSHDDVAWDACMTSRAACRTCRLFNSADSLAHDCDAFDDGSVNSSCAP